MKYCTAPFGSPAITPDGFMICSQPGQKVYNDISFWNSDEIQGLRQEIIDGKTPDGCKACKSIRDGLMVTTQKPTTVEVPVNFDYLYLARTNKCDYACEMCSSTISHSFDKMYNDGELGIIENNFDLLPYLHNTKHAAISGGNPVLDKKTLEIIQNLNPDSLTSMIFTSNGSTFPVGFIEAFKRLNCDICLIFSIDGPKEFNEVARFGAKQKRIYKTINSVLDQVANLPNISVAVEYTFTSKSIHHYVDLYDEMVFGLKREHLESVYMIPNMCGYPATLSATNISRSTYNHVVSNFIPYLQKQPIKLAAQFKLGLDRFIESYNRTSIM